MSNRRTKLIRLCAAALGLACIACGTPEQKPAAVKATVVPMMTGQGIPMSLASNYGFMSIQFSLGDVRSFASNFADSATLAVPTVGVLRGRDAIETKFAGEGKRYAVKEFNRSSSGFRIDGRDVTDSGTYKLVTAVPLAKGALDATGRYWTRWHYTEDGRWLIVSDSLAGVNKK